MVACGSKFYKFYKIHYQSIMSRAKDVLRWLESCHLKCLGGEGNPQSSANARLYRLQCYSFMFSISFVAYSIKSGSFSILCSTASSMVAPILFRLDATVDGFALNKEAISLLR